VLAVAVQLREFEFQKMFYDFYTFLYFISVYMLGVFTKSVRVLFSLQCLFSSPLATQEIRSVLENPKVHYRFHKSSSLVSATSCISPFSDLPTYSFTIHLILIFHLRLSLSSNAFSQASPAKPSMHFSSPHTSFHHPNCPLL